MKAKKRRESPKHRDFFIPYTDAGDGAANQHIAVWSALKADRSQRDILLASVMSHMLPASPSDYVDDVKWLCKEATKLEDLRNDATHAPLFAHRKMGGEFVVQPSVSFGNVRAKKLTDRGDLLAELRRGRDVAVQLAEYAVAIADAMRHFQAGEYGEWPERPILPPKPTKKVT
jgi:hypothetical protein